MFAAHGDRRLEGVGHDELSFISLVLGDLEASEKRARTGVERLAMAPAFLCHAQSVLARVLLARGRHVEEALTVARAGRALLAEVGTIEEGEGLIRLTLARGLHAAGKVDEAREVLLDAVCDLRRKAESITDVDVQRLFLAIPEDVQVPELAEEWGVGPG